MSGLAITVNLMLLSMVFAWRVMWKLTDQVERIEKRLDSSHPAMTTRDAVGPEILK